MATEPARHEPAHSAVPGEVRGTQHLTALAAPEALADWRLAVCFEAAYTAGVLDELPGTAAHLAAATNLDVDAVRAVLFVLASWGHVRVDERGVFSEGPDRLDAHERAALAQHGMWVRRWASLVPRRIHDRQAVAPEEPPRPDLATGMALLESAVRGYVRPVVDTCLSAQGRGANEAGAPRVLDLGGGHGAYAREFASRGCATTMQDLPGVIDMARTDGRLADAGVELVAADAFAHLAPGPFDLVLCGTLTNMFDLARVRVLLDRVRGILAPGGRLAIATWLREGGPVGAAFGVQMLVATPAGDAHSEDDYRVALTDTGYADIRTTEVGEPALGVILAQR